MSDPVPAVAEAAAEGETAAIFADIRQVLGVDVVNLIWRHLATIPGALPLVWGLLRPPYADGTIAAEAAALHGDLELLRLPPFPGEILAAVNLNDGDVSSVRNVLAAYDRTNAMALIALSALSVCLGSLPHSQQPASRHAIAGPDMRRAQIPLPALPAMAELPPAVADLVLRLNRLGTRRDSPILASMYRHLACWPGYLALAWTLIAPLDANRTLDRLIADALAKAQARATPLAMRLHAPLGAAIEPALGAAILAAIEPFSGDVIAKMVVICALLRVATSAPEPFRA